ncbi:hypothetical protein [Melaminivora sp.]|uniref:hypothetical protein n=1 Tax=Melaminivora sp. TaxID=1933032 RepID=UPI0028A80AEC|nr:hypothetical protein [Melaminivora sp.]
MWVEAPLLHQAMGLHGFTPERQLRLLAVASQPGAGRLELEMLWQVCASLQRLSYPVVVLDGTAAENEDAPGLAQLLGGMPWPADWMMNGTLPVVPAARGLVQLARRADTLPSTLAPLAPLFRSYAVAVLYAPAPLLAPLLARAAADHCSPLVMTGPGAQGMVGSYRQLKHLALHAGVSRSTVVSIQPPGAAPARQTAEALATLQRSAGEHLGLHVHTTTVAPGRAQDVQRLALQLLENACTMEAAGAGMPLLPGSSPAATPWSSLERSH